MNNFTLIIPTHNRHIYLKRSMEYFKNLVAEVIYCDSSPEKYQGELYSNIKYLHLPNKKFAGKIIVALTKIKTDFVAMCADDDFILIDSLYKGFDFLSNNKNFKTTVGKYIGFNECFNCNFFPIYQELPEDIDLGFDKNGEVFFKNYYQILWSMYDKKVLEKAFQIINEAKFHNDNFIELTVGTCACYEGGIKFLSEIWGVREISTQEHWGTRHVPILSMKIAEANGDYQRFKELVDFNTFHGCADGVMKSYLSGRTKNIGSLRNGISNMIPEVFKKAIRKCVFFQNPKTTIGLGQISKEYLSPISKLLSKDFQINC
jgi:glycosyltransferase domain-containing protein